MEISTVIHVAGGCVALLAGAIAILLKKGSKNHRQSGFWFVCAMLVMALPGGVVSYLAGRPLDVMSSVLAVYMVVTGWLAFRQVPGWGYIAMLCGAALCIAGYLSVELYDLVAGVRATDAPAGAGYLFATIIAFALWGDIRRLRQGDSTTQTQFLSKRKLTIRHLWRLNFGLFMATGSFFGARPQLFPDWMQAYGLLILLSVAPLLVMAYWRFKLR